MAVVCPFAKYRPLESSQREPRMAGHDVLCYHTMVGYLTSTDGYFRSGGWDGTESHWGVGGIWGPDVGGNLDGALFQWQDMLYQADANLHGNPRVLSIETADNAPRSASDLRPWTPKQVDTLIRLGIWATSKEAHRHCPSSWACHQHGIPRQLIPDTKPGRRGIGYHRQGVDPYRAAGGVKWSNAYGKVCPGDARIHQLINVVIPRIRGGQTDTVEEDMTPDQARKLDEVHKAVKDIGAVKFIVNLLWDLNSPNGFRYVDPDTGQIVAKGTPGAKPVTDLWRWARETAIQAREEPGEHASIEELIEQLRDLHVPDEPEPA